MVKIKLALIIILALLGIIIIFQNTGTVVTKILFAAISIPKASLLGITILIGFILGVMVSLMFLRKPRQR